MTKEIALEPKRETEADRRKTADMITTIASFSTNCSRKA